MEKAEAVVEVVEEVEEAEEAAAAAVGVRFLLLRLYGLWVGSNFEEGVKEMVERRDTNPEEEDDEDEDDEEEEEEEAAVGSR